MKFPSFFALAFLSLVSPHLHAAPRFLCCDYNGGKVAIVAADGKIEWEYACTAPQDCWKLPSGNILFCFSTGAMELTEKKEIAWQYTSPAGTEVHSCQPLADGRVLVTECGPSRLVEVDREGKVAKEIKLSPSSNISTHEQFRGARKLANGHYLICFKGDHKVVEVDGDAKVVHEIKVPGDVHAAIRLPDGHLLISCGEGRKVQELDEKDAVVWEIGEKDIPGNPLQLTAGCQRLANGNTLVCNYLGHGHIGQQPMFFEITRDKKIVWEFADHAHFKTINQVFLLDEPQPAVR